MVGGPYLVYVTISADNPILIKVYLNIWISEIQNMTYISFWLLLIIVSSIVHSFYKDVKLSKLKRIFCLGKMVYYIILHDHRFQLRYNISCFFFFWCSYFLRQWRWGYNLWAHSGSIKSSKWWDTNLSKDQCPTKNRLSWNSKNSIM